VREREREGKRRGKTRRCAGNSQVMEQALPY
jgi:hypothetical protein